MEVSKIYHIFESFGLSSYEAKAYSALFKESPLTGYQLSKISGVPRSRIYETLEKLSTKGFVLTQEGRPTTYIPITGDELIRKTERSLFNKIDHLRSWFDTIAVKKRIHRGIWNIEGRENILSKAEYMIFDASKSIILSGWAEDLVELNIPLKDAVSRAVDITVVSYGQFNLSGIKKLYQHQWQDKRKILVRDFALVIDNSNALIGNTSPDEKCSAAWTGSPGVTFTAREFILHTIVIDKLLTYIPPGIKRELMTFYNNELNI